MPCDQVAVLCNKCICVLAFLSCKPPSVHSNHLSAPTPLYCRGCTKFTVRAVAWRCTWRVFLLQSIASAIQVWMMRGFDSQRIHAQTNVLSRYRLCTTTCSEQLSQRRGDSTAELAKKGKSDNTTSQWCLGLCCDTWTKGGDWIAVRFISGTRQMRKHLTGRSIERALRQ